MEKGPFPPKYHRGMVQVRLLHTGITCFFVACPRLLAVMAILKQSLADAA